MEPSSGTDAGFFHVLQEPQPTSADDPFVGNETLDENLAESAQVAAWNAVGGHCVGLVVSATKGLITLCGGVETAADAQHCEAAVRAVSGVLDVVSNMTWKKASFEDPA
jgi:hypothetical protein